MKTLLVIAMLLAGCSKPSQPQQTTEKPIATAAAYTGQPLKDDRILCESKPYSDDDLKMAALDVVSMKLKYFGSDLPSLDRLRREESKLKTLTTWAGTIQNDKIRNAYLYWIVSYSRDYDEIEESIAHPSVTTAAQDSEREREEESARAAALARCLPKPTN